jgi:hypothetical protein
VFDNDRGIAGGSKPVGSLRFEIRLSREAARPVAGELGRKKTKKSNHAVTWLFGKDSRAEI